MKTESKPKNAGTKNFLLALNGQKTKRVPFWFMRQAGRYLPEYRELRTRKNGFLSMAMDPVAACEITMQPIRRFGMDAAIIFSDILVVPYALGQDLKFVEGEGPKLEALQGRTDLDKLNFEKFTEKLSPVYEALRNTRSALTHEGFHETALIGFAGAPWTAATYMLEGGSSREFLTAKKWMKENEKDFAALIDLLVEATALYLIQQVKAGAEALQIFDSWAGALDENQFQKYSIEPTKKIITKIREAYPDIPVIGFPKGAGENYIPYASETGITAIGLDPGISPEWAAKNLQSLLPVQGNLSPDLLLKGGKDMVLQAETILKTFSNGPFIFNLGHGINKDTPVENVELLVKTIKDWKNP